MYPNNIKCWLTWQEAKHNKTTYLGKFKWGRKQRTTIPENPHMHNFKVWYCSALNIILELLNMESKAIMLN